MTESALSHPFTGAAAPLPRPRRVRRKQPSPFSLRLSAAERQRLAEESGGRPLGEYIKEKLLSDGKSARSRRPIATVEDRQAMAQLLSLLGTKRYASNLNQLAHLANLGILAMTEDERLELAAAIAHIAELRRLLIQALGLKASGA